jgi:two-component system, NtrC family, sensor kinase
MPRSGSAIRTGQKRPLAFPAFLVSPDLGACGRIAPFPQALVHSAAHAEAAQQSGRIRRPLRAFSSRSPALRLGGRPLLSKWPIRSKLVVGLALLLAIVGMLSWGGLYGLYAYRDLVKDLTQRVNAELPLANQLSQRVGDLRGISSDAAPATTPKDAAIAKGPALGADSTIADAGDPAANAADEPFREKLAALEEAFYDYKQKLGDNPNQWETVQEIESSLARIVSLDGGGTAAMEMREHEELNRELRRLQELTAKLQDHLQRSINDTADAARTQYRALIILTWVTSITTAVMLALFVKLFYQWVFRPLRVLIKGSRRVAAGEFNYRIRLETHDEMSELADAMNDMTARFQAIRDDLDRQVQTRTKQVVRSEQLASVGFLAAGVAHEINNPLASIALCAESLEGRLADVLDSQDQRHAIVRQYLRMIQDEAFRCKEITEKLLDFSRMGHVKRQTSDLGELVQGVIDMLSHLGKYHDKHLLLQRGSPSLVWCNPQEVKQVVLNLLTNGLDCVDSGGTVRVELAERDGQAEMIVSDDGCGMTPEVLDQLFEPFFTRRRGGQGTGLGLSIVYRIVADHEGSIEVHSDGPGRGSQFRVRFPLARTHKEPQDRYQAA